MNYQESSGNSAQIFPGPTISTISRIGTTKDSSRSYNSEIGHWYEYMIRREDQHYLPRLQPQLVQSHGQSLNPLEQCAETQGFARINSIDPDWLVGGCFGAEEVGENISGGYWNIVRGFDDHVAGLPVCRLSAMPECDTITSLYTSCPDKHASNPAF